MQKNLRRKVETLQAFRLRLHPIPTHITAQLLLTQSRSDESLRDHPKLELDKILPKPPSMYIYMYTYIQYAFWFKAYHISGKIHIQ